MLREIEILVLPFFVALGVMATMDVSVGLAQSGDIPPPAPMLGPAEPSRDAQEGVSRVQSLLDQADSLQLQGKLPDARARLDEAQRAFDQLGKQRGSEVPHGYVPGFVVEERIGALRQQIDEKAARQ